MWTINIHLYLFPCLPEYFMRLGNVEKVDPGDIATLITPYHTFGGNTSVTFRTKMSTEEYDVLPKFKVFLKSDSGIQREPLLIVEKTWK